MTETTITILSSQLDQVAASIKTLESLLKVSYCEDIKEDIQKFLVILKAKEKELNKKFNRAYKEFLDLADFLSSVDYE